VVVVLAAVDSVAADSAWEVVSRPRYCPARAPALRAFLGGRSIIVTQFLTLGLGTHARNASRNSRAQSGVLLSASRIPVL